MEQGESRRHARIAVDFDGTLARKSWPVIDKDTVWNDVLDSWLKRHKARGDYVMLWTCRENYGGIRFPDHEYLNDAIRCCTRHQLFFDGVNRNVGEAFGEYLSGTEKYGRKLCADVYIDDRSLPFNPDGRFARFFWRTYLWLMDRKLARLGLHD
jgi:hypothetical protein